MSLKLPPGARVPAPKMPARGNVEAVLRVVEATFPRYNVDREMRRQAIMALSQCLGSCLAWTLYQEGEQTLDRDLGLVQGWAKHTAQVGASALRQRDEARRIAAASEQKQSS